MISENVILRNAMDLLRERLPRGWTAELVPRARAEADRAHDVALVIASPDGREARIVVEARRRLDPRRALDLGAKLKRDARDCAVLAVAPWMSRATREVLIGEEINLVDLTGSVRLSLSEPGLFIDAAGASQDPSPEKSRVTLRGAKAARVVRALCASPLPLRVRQLASRANTTPGYVSKLLKMLDQQAAVARTEGGGVGEVDLRRLVERWAEDAPLKTRTSRSSWIAPRGLTALQQRLLATAARYVVTGSLAAAKKAPVVAPRLVSLYVEDPRRFAESVDLHPAEAGANVLLLVPDDDYPFEHPWTHDGIRYAALPQVAADLLTGPGRGPAEADALLAWMRDNPEVWRG